MPTTLTTNRPAAINLRGDNPTPALDGARPAATPATTAQGAGGAEAVAQPSITDALVDVDREAAADAAADLIGSNLGLAGEATLPAGDEVSFRPFTRGMFGEVPADVDIDALDAILDSAMNEQALVESDPTLLVDTAVDTSPIPAGYTRAPSLDSVVANGGSIKKKMAGAAVTELQTLLKNAGFDVGIDGKFGTGTYNALRRFQRRHGLGVDGKAGRDTIMKLRNPGATSVQPGSTAAASALDHARSQVGVRERSGRNDGVPAERYSSGRREPWCANFVAWTFRKAGKPLPGNQRSLASVQYMEDRMKRAGAWTRRSQANPKPGDIIFFKNRGGSDRGGGRHVGMVERVANGRVYTIEGNSSNSVRRRSYPLNNHRISGYGRW